MKRSGFHKIVIPAVFLFFLFSALTFAADKGIFRIQGIVMELDFKKKTMNVNETSITWDPNIVVNNEKGYPVPVDSLRRKTWVYVEGVNDKAHKKLVAKKIYILPKFIDGKEKRLYPFIK